MRTSKPVSPILIAYYSRPGGNYSGGRIVDLKVGNTERAAGLLAELTGGAVYRIEAVRRYPEDYEECTRVARDELRRKARPDLVGPDLELPSFDTLILGYPNWWGTMPMPVFTFLEGRDWTGITLLPFCTHEGSGLGGSENDLRSLCAGARLLPGLALVGSEVKAAKPELRAWLARSLPVS